MSLSLALLDNSKESIPEEFDGSLDCSSLSVCCAFNRRGSLLAVGCNDGRVVIWDFLTRQVAKSFTAHTGHPACSINWSRNGRKIVSSSVDNTIAVWDVVTGTCLTRWRYPTPILKAQFNPRNDRMVLVCPHKSQALLLHIDYNENLAIHKILPADREDAEYPNNIASFDRRGQYIYLGNARGRLVILRCPQLDDSYDLTTVDIQVVSSFKIQTTVSASAAIREIEFGARNKKTFLVNSSDRTIRLYDCNAALKAGVNGSCEELRKFQDLVNKTMWRRCCFSGDTRGSYVCGGSARQHSLYIWESENGSIKKMLQGTKGELLLDVQWHPLRPIVASISSGLVSIWARPQFENWSAFAPDFKELDENLEYHERESEFDLEDEDNIADTKKIIEDDIGVIDVAGDYFDPDLLSSDEEGLDPDYLELIPVKLDDQLESDLS